MKKLRNLLILIIVLSLVMVGCVSTPPETGGNGTGGENLVINKGDKNNPTYSFLSDGELTELVRDKQATVNKITATDDFNRTVKNIDGYKTDKDRYVGLFYFTWLGQHGAEMGGIYDVGKLLDSDPNDLWNEQGTSKSPLGKYHFWGEPLYGYYNSLDPWVMRKQIELFTMAGIDFLALDCTNGFDYIQVVTVLFEILQEYYDMGWDVPKIMFYTNSNSGEVVRQLYNGRPTSSSNILEKEGIYKKGHYKDLWFMPDGVHPKIAAITDPNSTTSEAGKREEFVISADENLVTDPTKRALNKEILQFFDFWESTWPNNVQYENGLPWMDWTTNADGTKGDQTVLTDTINVSVAQHNRLPFSNALKIESEAEKMWGRGFSKTTGADHSDDAIESGVNFEEEWKVALEKDVKYTFVTGWNEWVAIKSANKQWGVYFVDTVNKEYSRDAEMMKDGYKDNSYLQIMRNTRVYKGKDATFTASAQKSIDIKKGLSQWNDVADIYDGFTGAINRDFKNFSGQGKYEDNSMKNDIQSVRVSSDADNLYFLVECVDDIQKNEDASNWMNILLDIEGQNNDAFYGYDYVINRQSSYSGESSVEKFALDKNDELEYKLTAKANFTINGKFMQYKISKKDLGITGNFTLNFKVADNVTDPTDIQSYYITGDCAPVGRLNFTYKG